MDNLIEIVFYILLAVALLSLVVGVLFLFVNIIFRLVEEILGKPLYVHFYPRLKVLSPRQQSVLSQNFPFYQKLNTRKRAFFDHRVAAFLEHYQFIGRQDFEVTDEVRVRIGGTFIMLTFGMREYLFEVFDKIIIYPGEYYSSICKTYHKGEFNPKLKAIVFSWEDFEEGLENQTNNRNLGLHEFTHALHFHGLKRVDTSGAVFSMHLKRILAEIQRPRNRQRLIESDYFRIYAYTNEFEFISVIIEHYFETPDQFRREFPELFFNVSKMLNQQILAGKIA